MKVIRQLLIICFCFILILGCGESNPVDQEEEKEEIISQEVSFQNDTLSLNGTLTLPNKESTYPAIIIIPGSGAINQDGEPLNSFSTLPPIYKEWSEFFASEGIATLRYNKRFITYPSLAEEVTLRVMAEDVISAVSFLQNESNIQSDNIYLLGHSQGGNIAPIVRDIQKINISGYSLVATSNIAIDSLLIEQLEHNSQTSESEIEKIKQDFQDLRENNLPENYQILDINKQFWNEWILFSQKADSIVKSKNSPVFIVQGEEDQNFPDGTLEQNIAKWRETAEASQDIIFQLYKNTTHEILNSNTSQVDKDVLSEIANWINNISS